MARARSAKVERKSAADADARSAVLQAAIEAIEEGGLATLSMRDVARRAGVSHQLPYHYFADREAILAAIAEAGFEILGQRLRAAEEMKGTGAERIAEAGRAYVAFACEYPAHFRVMFRQDFVDLMAHPAAHAKAETCFSRLPNLVAACVKEGLSAEPDETALTILGWSLAHGLSCLLLDGPLAKKLPDAAEAREHTVAGVMLAMRRLIEQSSARPPRKTTKKPR